MIKIYYFNIEYLKNSTIQEWLNQIPLVMKVNLLKFREEKDRARGLVGKLLLKKLLEEIGYSSNVLEEIKLDKYKRPYLNREIDFNIAHSGDYVICGISEVTRIGLDIEQINVIDIIDYDMVLTDWEKMKLKTDEFPYVKFYEIWSQKEAVSKADGRGLGISFCEIEIQNDTVKLEKEKWLLKKIEIDSKYRSYVAFQGDREVKVVEIKDLYK